MKAAMIGCGKLGYPVGLAWALKHDMVGYDIAPFAKEIEQTGYYPHREPAAQDLMATSTFRIVDTLDEAVAHAEIVFLAVETPHGPKFEGITRMPEERSDFDYTAMKTAFQSVADAAEKQGKHVVVVVISTTLPGTCERELVPLMNDHVSFVYAPMFIAQSTVVEDTLFPEFVLLGVDKADARAVEMVRAFFMSFHPTNKLRFMSVTSAELTKVAYNVFLGLKIVAANSIMEIAHKTGANCDDVTDALAMATDRIVSSKYMRGGMGDGGGCFVPGSLIHTEQGVCAIEDIQKGDRVLGGDGKLHEVLETYRRPYKGKVYTIKGQGLEPFTVTPEHPIYTPRFPQGGLLLQVPAAALTTQDRIVFPETAHHPIQSIAQSDYEGTVYNLNVADVHNYVSVGGLVANCHPRDQIALSWLAQDLFLSYDLFGSMVSAREAQTEWLGDLCHETAIAYELPLIILGKAYKKGTNLTIGSPAILLKTLIEEGRSPVEQWDPYVDPPRTFTSPAVFVLATNHDQFYEMKYPDGSVVIDPWGVMRDTKTVQVVRVGRN